MFLSLNDYFILDNYFYSHFSNIGIKVTFPHGVCFYYHNCFCNIRCYFIDSKSYLCSYVSHLDYYLIFSIWFVCICYICVWTDFYFFYTLFMDKLNLYKFWKFLRFFLIHNLNCEKF